MRGAGPAIGSEGSISFDPMRNLSIEASHGAAHPQHRVLMRSADPPAGKILGVAIHWWIARSDTRLPQATQDPPSPGRRVSRCIGFP